MAKGTRLESVRGESLRGFKSHSFRQWRRGLRPDGTSDDRLGRAPHGAVAPAVLPLAGWLVCAAWFFRAPLLSRFTRVHGELGDTRLIAVLREHWWKVLRGDVTWRDPGFFHPWKGAIGYSDTFLLESLVYVPWRVFGVEPLLAGQLTVITLSGIGFAGWWVAFGRLGLADRRWHRLGLTVLAAFPHQLAQQVLHQQILSVWWLPWALVLGHMAMTGAPRRRILAGGGAGLLWGLVLASTVYIGWFVLFVSGLLAVVLTIGEILAGRGRTMVSALRRGARPIMSGFLGFAVGLIPFFLVYLPAFGEQGARPYGMVAQLGPRPFDLINLGGDNLLWGVVLRAVAPGNLGRLGNIEVAMAVGPLLLIVAAVSWWRLERPADADQGRGPGRRRVAGALLLVAATALLLPVEWGPFSAWRAVYAVVPGAGALRVAGRLWIVAHLLVVVALAIVSAARPRTRTLDIDGPDTRGGVRSLATGLVVVLLVTEQVDLANRASLDRQADLTLVASAVDPPEWCEVVAVAGGDTSWAFLVPSVDAMRVADSVDLPTLHGYSGGLPPGYPIVHNDPRYRRRFRKYVRSLGLTEPVCVFDLDSRRWLDEPLDVG